MNDALLTSPITKPKIIPKAWGQEEIFASNDKYCGKILRFEKGWSGSLHFHVNKHETFMSLDFVGELVLYDTLNGRSNVYKFNPGDVIELAPGQPHRLIAYSDGAILEVSTKDDPSDSYRVSPSFYRFTDDNKDPDC